MEKEYYKNLFDKYLNGSISEAEVEELIVWLKENEELTSLWEARIENVTSKRDPALKKKMLEQIKSEIGYDNKSKPKSPFKRAITSKQWMKWAAIILLPVCILYSVYHYSFSSPSNQTAFIVKADKGNKADITLSDGTNIILNADSKISYQGDFGVKERRIQLLDGEGYFNVTQDPKRTFIVQVGDLSINVKGTIFNVCAYHDSKEIIVVLLEGKVIISTSTSASSLSMDPGDKMIYDKSTHKMITEKVCADKFISWTKGYLYFQNESLESITKALSRVYNIPIHITSPTVAKERFTGTIPGGGIEQSLNTLMLTSSFCYELEDSVVTVKGK